MLSIAKYILFAPVNQQSGLPWWAWFLLFVVIILLFILLWVRFGLAKGGENLAMPFKDVNEPAKPQVSTPVQPVSPTKADIKADDLTRVEGIGPKIAGTLQNAGIYTFDRLAQSDAATLEKILRDAGLRLADPESWPEQAKLLAEGKLNELKTLQDTLKGGRRA